MDILICKQSIPYISPFLDLRLWEFQQFDSYRIFYFRCSILYLCSGNVCCSVVVYASDGSSCEQEQKVRTIKDHCASVYIEIFTFAPKRKIVVDTLTSSSLSAYYCSIQFSILIKMQLSIQNCQVTQFEYFYYIFMHINYFSNSIYTTGSITVLITTINSR